jgi:hypothetical protein
VRRKKKKKIAMFHEKSSGRQSSENPRQMVVHGDRGGFPPPIQSLTRASICFKSPKKVDSAAAETFLFGSLGPILYAVASTASITLLHLQFRTTRIRRGLKSVVVGTAIQAMQIICLMPGCSCPVVVSRVPESETQNRRAGTEDTEIRNLA